MYLSQFVEYFPLLPDALEKVQDRQRDGVVKAHALDLRRILLRIPPEYNEEYSEGNLPERFDQLSGESDLLVLKYPPGDFEQSFARAAPYVIVRVGHGAVLDDQLDRGAVRLEKRPHNFLGGEELESVDKTPALHRRLVHDLPGENARRRPGSPGRPERPRPRPALQIRQMADELRRRRGYLAQNVAESGADAAPMVHGAGVVGVVGAVNVVGVVSVETIPPLQHLQERL